MAGGPSVVATISAKDMLTGVLTSIVEHSQTLMNKVNRGVEEHTARQTAAVDKFHARFSQVKAAVNEAATGMFAGMGAHFLHEASHVATELSALERKMVAFGGVSKRQADDLRRYADTTASGSTGGPVGQTDLVTQLLMNGYKPEQAKVMMEPISLYALETGQGLSEAATEFDGHMNMLHRVKDDKGREISSGSASPEQLKRAAEETLGAMSIYFQQMKGKISDVMEFSKVAAPSSNMLKVPEHFMFAEEAVLSQQGIRGEVAGTAVAGFNRRLIGQTAKGRAAMAEAGLHYSDYVQLNPELLTAEGVTAAFEQRAGSADAGEKAKIKAAVDKFHKDHDYDSVNTALSDAFTSSGNKGLHNRVAASNAAADITKGAVTGVDQEKFLQDVHDKGVSVGLIQTMFREQANAVMTLKDNIDELKRIRGNFDTSDPHAAYGKARDEQFDNYAGSQQNLSGAWTGLQAETFRPMEGVLTSTFNTLAEGIRSVAGASEGARIVLDSVLVAGTTLAGLKLGGQLANFAGGLSKLVTGAEEVGPLVGALGLLADVPFLPIVAGIGAVVAGFEAFEHRAALWHKFELWKNGDVDNPTTPEEANGLRERVDRDRKALADHQKAIEDHAAAMDPAVRAAREHASEVLRRGLLDVDHAPAVVAARDHLAAAENNNPRHDPAIRAAREHLAEVEAAYAKRQATSDEHIDSLHRVIDHVKKTDPLAGDADLKRTQTDLAGLRARLGTAAENDPAFRSLDAHRKERETYLLDFQRQVIAKAVDMVEQERDRLNAPKVTADDLAAARKAAEQAPAAAQDRHQAGVEQGQAELDRVLGIARQAVQQSAAVVEANAAAAQATDSARNGPRARMELQADPEIAKLSAEIDKLSGVLATYDQSHATAYAQSHPTFTRDGMGLGEAPAVDYSHPVVPRTGPAFDMKGPVTTPDAGLAVAPRLSAAIDRLNGVLTSFDRFHGEARPTLARPGMGLETPPVDYSHPTIPRTGPSFDSHGPVVDTASLSNSLSASIMHAIYPERAPQKVDVHSDVHSDVAVKGTVTGTIEGNTRVEVAVQPSPQLLATIARAEMASKVALHGDVSGSGGGDYMGGSNGVVQHPGVHPMLNGVGHN